MKKHSWKVIAMALILGVSAVLVSAKTYGSDSFRSLKFEIPFEFQVGNDKFPAGKYRFNYMFEKNFIVLESIDNNTNKLIVGVSSFSRYSARQRYDENKLTFHRYGNKHFLRVVSSPSTAYSIGESKAEKRVRKGYTQLVKRTVKQGE